MRNGMVLYSGTRRERERQMNEKQWSEEKSAWQDGENVLNWLSCSREIGWNTSKYVWKKKWKKFLTNGIEYGMMNTHWWAERFWSERCTLKIKQRNLNELQTWNSFEVYTQKENRTL